jgi:hypothetical protein
MPGMPFGAPIHFYQFWGPIMTNELTFLFILPHSHVQYVT